MIIQTGFTHEGKPYNYAEYQCDYEAEVKDLPKLGVCCASSKAFVTETNNLYALSNQDTWELCGNTKSSGSPSIEIATTSEVTQYLGI